MLKKYLLQNTVIKRDIVVGFNENGLLVFFDADCELSDKQARWFQANVPFEEKDLPELVKKSQGRLTVTKAQTDLSFDAIWNKYNYKVGKKDKTQKLWEKMSDAERLATYKMLPAYNSHLNRTSEGKAYLETFLRNKYWENEYK